VRFDIDPAKVLYAIGFLFGVAAVLYFARDLVFELSITVRSLLLLFTFIGFLVGTVAAGRSEFVLGFAVLGAATYLAFLAYTIPRFNVGSEGTFLALLVSAGLFVALGYLLRERELAPSRSTTRALLVAVVVLAAVSVGADIVASGVQYGIEVNDAATPGERGQVELGTVTLETRFLFREPIDVPRAFACIYVPGATEFDMRPQPVDYRVDGDRLPDSLPGGQTLQVSMSIRLSDEETAALDGAIPIERASNCPETSDTARVLVLFGEDRPLPPEPGR
jgi:hypothetical protein